MKGGGAPFCSALRAMRSRKDRASQNSEAFFGGPGSQGPSGQAKERTRILPVRRGSFCPACRAVCWGGRFCETCRYLACWLLRPVFRREFPAAALAAVRALCRRWACVLWLCSRSEGLTFCRFCCGFCAWPALLPVAFVLRLRCWGLLAVCPPCACVCRTFAAAVWLAAPGCREVLPRRGCA